MYSRAYEQINTSRKFTIFSGRTEIDKIKE